MFRVLIMLLVIFSFVNANFMQLSHMYMTDYERKLVKTSFCIQYFAYLIDLGLRPYGAMREEFFSHLKTNTKKLRTWSQTIENLKQLVIFSTKCKL